MQAIVAHIISACVRSVLDERVSHTDKRHTSQLDLLTESQLSLTNLTEANNNNINSIQSES